MDSMTLLFGGPYSWPGLPDAPSIFDAPAGSACGIYLWTVPQDTDSLIHYVGQTGRSFAARMQEHYKEHAAGFYSLYDVPSLRRGERKLLWPGMFRKPRPSPSECVRRLLELAPLVDALNNTYRFYLAPVKCSSRLRDRAEAALASALYASPPPVGTFQESIRYRPRLSSEQPIVCHLTCAGGLRGLPSQILV